MTTKAIREMFYRWKEGSARNEDSDEDWELAQEVVKELQAIDNASSQEADCLRAANKKHIWHIPTDHDKEVCAWCGVTRPQPASAGPVEEQVIRSV